MLQLLVLVSVLLAFSLLFARHRWYAPTVLVCGVWFASLAAYALLDGGAHPLGRDTIRIISMWLLCFCVAAWAVQSLYVRPIFRDVRSNVVARDVYYYFALCTLPVMIIEVVLVVLYTGGNPFSALRDANIAETNGVRTTGFFILFWLVSYIMELRVVSSANIRRVVLLLLVNLSYAFISMGKMNFLVLFLSSAIVLTERGMVRWRHLLLGASVLLLLFAAVQVIRGSHTSPKRFVALYMTSSIANLNSHVQPSSADQFGENTFRFYYAVKAKLDGGQTKAVDPVLAFNTVEVGKDRLYSNTYTTLYPFYKDFGKTGVWVFAIVLGLLFGYLFKAGEDGSECAVVLYAILASCLVMQFIGDTFFTVLSQNLQYLIAAVLPYVVSRRIKV